FGPIFRTFCSRWSRGLLRLGNSGKVRRGKPRLYLGFIYCSCKRVSAEDSRGGPLADHCVSTMLFFRYHGLVERFDGAVDMVIGGVLSGYTRQPEARGRQECRDRATLV